MLEHWSEIFDKLELELTGDEQKCLTIMKDFRGEATSSIPGRKTLQAAGLQGTQLEYVKLRESVIEKLKDLLDKHKLTSVDSLAFQVKYSSSDHVHLPLPPKRVHGQYVKKADRIKKLAEDADVSIMASGSPTRDLSVEEDSWAPRPVKIVFSAPELPPAPKSPDKPLKQCSKCSRQVKEIVKTLCYRCYNQRRPYVKVLVDKRKKRHVTEDPTQHPCTVCGLCVAKIGLTGLCRYDYLQQRKEKKKLPPCVDCGSNKILARGRCKSCYQVWYRSPTTDINNQEIPVYSPSPIDRVDDVCSDKSSDIEVTQECQKAASES